MAKQPKIFQYIGYTYAAGRLLGGSIGFFQKRAEKKLKTAIETNHRKLTEEFLGAHDDNKGRLSSVDPALLREATFIAKNRGARSGISAHLGLPSGPLGTS